MKHIKSIITLPLSLFLYSMSSFAVYAAPTISGITGTVTHGGSITVNGSGFGTKSPVAPLKWDPVDGVVTGNPANGTLLSWSQTLWKSGVPGVDNAYPPYYKTTNPRGKYTASYSNQWRTSGNGKAVVGGDDFSSVCNGGKLFVSYWFYPAGNIGIGSNKYFRINNISSQDTIIHTPADGGHFQIYDGVSTYRINKYLTTHYNTSAWNRMDVLVDNSGINRPHVKVLINNSTEVDETAGVGSCGSACTAAPLSDSQCQIYALGLDAANSDGQNPTFDFGQIYVDSTQARVEICNAGTKAGSNHCEIQIPQTQWIDGQLQVMVNQGSFSDGATAYLYVIDANGNESTGKQITFGSSVTTAPPVTYDTTAPTLSIASPVSGASVSGNVSVSVTAYDNIGVTKAELYINGALSNTVTTAPYNFTWNTSSLINGSYTLLSKAYDAAGNVGTSSSITVTVNNPVAVQSPSGLTRNECAKPPTGTIFCEDFEGTNPKANFNDYDGNPDTENQIVTYTGPSGDTTNKAIRLRVPAGLSGASDLLKVLPQSYDKLYARWYFQYEPGFNFSARNHGGGLAAGDRGYVGQSGNRPTGADFAGFYVQYNSGTPYTAAPYAYSYYRGMYQDCSNPIGGCWGDSLPCIYDNGAYYCTKSQDRPTVTLPTLVAGKWYCYEQMVDMGAPTTTGTGAAGRITQWLDGNTISDNTNLWFRTISSLKIQNLWLSLYHHDGTHSVVGEVIDNVVVSTQRIGCGGPLPVTAPTGVQIKQVTP